MFGSGRFCLTGGFPFGPALLFLFPFAGGQRKSSPENQSGSSEPEIVGGTPVQIAERKLLLQSSEEDAEKTHNCRKEPTLTKKPKKGREWYTVHQRLSLRADIVVFLKKRGIGFPEHPFPGIFRLICFVCGKINTKKRLYEEHLPFG